MVFFAILGRFLMAVFGLGLLFVAFDGFYNNFLEAPRFVIFQNELEHFFRLIDRMDCRQGAPLVQGFFAMGLGLWALNAAFRFRPVDAILANVPMLAVLAVIAICSVPKTDVDPELLLGFTLPKWYLIGAVVASCIVGFFLNELRTNEELPTWIVSFAVFCFALIGVLWFRDYKAYSDPNDAVSAFIINKVQVKSAGPYLFGRGEDGQVHLAKLTPDFVRALDKQSLEINVDGKNQPEFPMPGFLPILFLLTLGAIGCRQLGSDVDSWSQRWRQGRLILAFGIINLFVVGWLLFGTLQVYSSNYLGLLLVGCGAPLLAVGAIKCSRNKGWQYLYFSIHLGAVAGIYLQTFKTPGTPVAMWLLAYLGAGAFCWWTIVTAESK